MNGPVRVPENAGLGNAKVTFRFDNWKTVKVASSTYEIPIVDPNAEGERKKSTSK